MNPQLLTNTVAVIVRSGGGGGVLITSNGKVLLPKGGPDNNPFARAAATIEKFATVLAAAASVPDASVREEIEATAVRAIEARVRAMGA